MQSLFAKETPLEIPAMPEAAGADAETDQGQGTTRQVIRDMIDDSQQLDKRRQSPLDPAPPQAADVAEVPSTEDPFALFEDFEFDGAASLKPRASPVPAQADIQEAPAADVA